jgi:hypothetical protein
MLISDLGQIVPKAHFADSQVLIDMMMACKSQKLRETHLSPKEKESVSNISKSTGVSILDILGDLSHMSPQTKFIFNDKLSAGPITVTKSSDVVRQHDDLVRNILSDIKTWKASDISDGKISEGALAALSETLSRVDPKKYELEKKRLLKNSPEQIYAWAISNANIVFPYLCLSKAEKHLTAVSRTLISESYWGLKENKFILPKLESISNSNAWIILTQLACHLLGEENVEFSYQVDETVPELSNDDMAKDTLAEAAILRLLELSKSPNTATFRSGTKLQEGELAKNCVDFIILDALYRDRSDCFGNLTVSGKVVSQCRRTERVERADGNKISVSLVYTGYKLSDIFRKYITRKISKVPENEPFIRFITDLCELLCQRVDKNFSIPKAYFMSPSDQLRSRVRRGPNIKTKSGEKANLYIPFSFAKSKECSLLPENTKKTMIDLGSEIIKSLDSINKLPVVEANKKLALYEEYIEASYTISDECRKRWRTTCSIPNAKDLEEVFCIKDKTSGMEISEEIVMIIKSAKLAFLPYTPNSDELSNTKRFISELNESRKTKRIEASKSRAV